MPALRSSSAAPGPGPRIGGFRTPADRPGVREGVTAGQIFKVGSSEVLRDPGTGETLDVVFTAKGEIRVETVREKTAICSIMSGEGFQPDISVSPP